MKSATWIRNEETKWLSLINALPGSEQEMGAQLMAALQANGYVHLKWPMLEENHEAVAAQMGTITVRSDIKIDKVSEQIQEQSRVLKGLPGRYRASSLAFHTDNARVDVMSMYCVEQDAIDGAILLLDTNDLAEHFSTAQLAILSRVELWAPPYQQSYHSKQKGFSDLAYLLSKTDEGYRVYYIPWLLLDSYDSDSGEMLKKFSDYVKHKEQTQLIRLPVKKNECVFVDNHRMLHGRGAIAEDSKRHFVRLYIQVPSMSMPIRAIPEVSQGSVGNP